MEEKKTKILAKLNHKIELNAIAGHFATSHSHINYYLDITPIKCRHTEAQLVAKEFVKKYNGETDIDTIVCMDGCDVIGAYLAEEITNAGIHSSNEPECINVIKPETNLGGQIVFRDNVESMLNGKHVILVLASATTGKTIEQSVQAIKYYGGIVEGISAIFSATEKVGDLEVDSIFQIEDVEDYQTYSPVDCPFCKAQKKIDAIVNSYGYSKI